MSNYETEFDYGFGFTPKDVKPVTRLRELSTFSISYLNRIMKEMQEEENDNRFNKDYKLIASRVYSYCDEDGDECDALEALIVDRETYNTENYLYSIDDFVVEIDKKKKAEAERLAKYPKSVISKEHVKGPSSEWSDGSCSTTTTIFDNGLKFVDKMDSCPGASRSTRYVLDVDGKILAYYTYCEDAGNRSGDQELMRVLSNMSYDYKTAA